MSAFYKKLNSVALRVALFNVNVRITKYSVDIVTYESFRGMIKKFDWFDDWLIEMITVC